MTKYENNILYFYPNRESDNKIKYEHKYNTLFRISIPNIKGEKLIHSISSTYRLIYKLLRAGLNPCSHLRAEIIEEELFQTNDPGFMMYCPDSGLEYINSTYAECGIHKSSKGRVFLTYKSKIELNDVLKIVPSSNVNEIVGFYLISVEVMLVDKHE
jgi:hypothetical protein